MRGIAWESMRVCVQEKKSLLSRDRGVNIVRTRVFARSERKEYGLDHVNQPSQFRTASALSSTPSGKSANMLLNRARVLVLWDARLGSGLGLN